MSYGIEKITAPTLLKMILAEIERDLLKMDSFNNQSLSYYGAEIDYKVNLKLHTKTLTERTAQKSEARVGDLVDPDATKVSVKGKRVAGSKVVVEPGAHVRPPHGTPLT